MFGLGREELADVLILLSNSNDISDFQYKVVHSGDDFSGYNGEKAVLQFDVTCRGKVQQFRCFVKKMNFGFSEANVYQSINKCDGPIPQLYCSFITKDNSEVVFLELLNRVGIHSTEDKVFEQLLNTLAEFNALDLSLVPTYQPAILLEQVNWLSKVWATAYIGKVGENLQAVFENLPAHRHKLSLLYEDVQHTLSSRDLDVTHHDPADFNLGYDKNDRLVLFDLHYVTAYPRFKDLAQRLGASASPMPESRAMDEWIAVYLETYNNLKGRDISIETCKTEMETLKQAQRLFFSEQCYDEALRSFNTGDEQV
jgi:hypothetical protein